MFKPMKGQPLEDFENLRYPLVCSTKLDGIRCIYWDGKLYSSTLKPIPNRHITQTLTEELKHCNGILDGELIVGASNSNDTFRNTSSGVMSIDGEPDFKFYLFDNIYNLQDVRPFGERVQNLPTTAHVEPLPQTLIVDECELKDFIDRNFTEGFEGVILRDPDGPYKFGRSTEKEGYLWKVKKFADAEAIVIGVEELYRNTAESTTDALGLKRKTKKKADLMPAGVLGKLVVQDFVTGVRFRIGSGFNDAERLEYWVTPPIGAIVKYRYHDHGIKDKPRQGIFHGIRHRDDFII